MICLNPLASRKRCLANHVLSGCVGGRVVEAQVKQTPNHVWPYLDELAGRGCYLGGATNLVQVSVDPLTQPAGFERVTHFENRRALHTLLDDRSLDAPALGQHAHAPVVARHQRAFGGCQRNVKVAARVFSDDAQRTRKAKRNLRDACEVLDVPRQQVRCEGVLRHVLQPAAGLLLNERAPKLRCLARVIVVFVAGNGDALRGTRCHSVLA